VGLVFRELEHVAASGDLRVLAASDCRSSEQIVLPTSTAAACTRQPRVALAVPGGAAGEPKTVSAQGCPNDGVVV
jgi:hypothetical protein